MFVLTAFHLSMRIRPSKSARNHVAFRFDCAVLWFSLRLRYEIERTFGWTFGPHAGFSQRVLHGQDSAGIDRAASGQTGAAPNGGVRDESKCWPAYTCGDTRIPDPDRGR